MAGTGKAHLRPGDDVLVTVEDLVVEFPVGRGRTVKAVSGISFDIRSGETLGLVGESGCGKSTSGRAIIQLPRPTSGSVTFGGVHLADLSDEEIRQRRTHIQMIFQDPISSLNPRRTVGDIVAEPLRVWGPSDASEQEAIVDRMLDSVGVDPDTARDKRPHEFSGGQCQRISIARSLVMLTNRGNLHRSRRRSRSSSRSRSRSRGRLLICDEPVSSLDVSVQAQILNLLEDLKAGYGLTMMFIAHDLAVVKNISDRVAVMYLGKLCEVADPDTLYAEAAHPYTDLLLGSVPEPDPTVEIDEGLIEDGELPSPSNPPSGCRFRTRCERVTDLCSSEEPQMRAVGDDHFVACHHPLAAVAG